jgi:hypothetical protein
MSQLKVNAISDSAGANGNAITLATDGTCTAKITNNLSNRNLIINGAMQVAQRGTSSTTNGYGSVDRFKINHSGCDEDPTHAQIDLTSSDTGPWAKGFRNALQVTNGNQTSTGANDFIEVDQRFEARNIANSGWDYTSASSYITLSFWVKSSVAQNFYGWFQSGDGTKQQYAFETGSLTANTWTYITKTIPGNSNIQIDNNYGQGLLVRFFPFRGTDTTGTVTLNQWMAYASSARTPDNATGWWTTNDATFALTGVQLEVGDVATEFEHRSYGDELNRCERYFQKFGGSGTSFLMPFAVHSSSAGMAAPQFRTTMRAAPTLTATSVIGLTNGNGSAGSPDVAIDYVHNNSLRLKLTNMSNLVQGDSSILQGGNVTLSAEL